MDVRRYRDRLVFITSFLLIAIAWPSIAEAQQGKVIYDTIHSQSLEGNLLKDPSTRSITIYLPPGYDEGDSLYPVVYYLHGYTANNTMWITFFGIHNVMNNLIKQGKVQEMILVMPNAFNKYGGSWYSNSSVAGNYEDYITRDLVDFIDSNYRTLPQRESRAIGGGSMGGYGAMKLATKHPDVYCAVVCHCGLLSIEHWKTSVRLNPSYILGGYPIYQAMAIAWSPNPDSKLLYDYPADDQRNLLDDVWERWMEHDPLTLAKENSGNLKQLAGIYFDHGRSDPTVNVAEARDFDQALTESGIPHVYVEYSGGHCTGSIDGGIVFLSDLLSPEMLVSVESVGKLATTWGEIRRGQ